MTARTGTVPPKWSLAKTRIYSLGMEPLLDAEKLTPLQLELREAATTWGCPLCKLADRAERTYVASLNYERVLDLKTRDALKASRGLCERHGQVWRNVQGSALGIAIVYRISILDLLRDTESHSEGARGLFSRRGRASAVSESLKASHECPACIIGEDTARRFGALLIKDLGDGALRSRLVACGGLCLPHLRAVLEMPGADRVSEPLLHCHRQVWERLLGELEEFIRKNDYRFSDEHTTPREGTSWTRALNILTGHHEDVADS